MERRTRRRKNLLSFFFLFSLSFSRLLIIILIFSFFFFFALYTHRQQHTRVSSSLFEAHTSFDLTLICCPLNILLLRVFFIHHTFSHTTFLWLTFISLFCYVIILFDKKKNPRWITFSFKDVIKHYYSNELMSNN